MTKSNFLFKIAAGLIFIFLISVKTYSQDTLRVEKSNYIENINNRDYYIHFVKKGNTLYSISKAYGVDIDVIVKENSISKDSLNIGQLLKIPVKAENNILPPEINSDKKIIFHVIEKGETLYSLSKKYYVTYDELYELNPEIKDGLKVGYEIKIPLPQKEKRKAKSDEKQDKTKYISHIIKRKETLYGISKKYSVSISELIILNPELKNGLKKGMKIKIPKTDKSFTKKQMSFLKFKGDTIINYVKHKVKKREDLESIANDYAVKVEDILDANPDARFGIKKRQILMIPVKVIKPPENAYYNDNLDILDINDKNFEDLCNESPENIEKKYKVALMLPLHLDEANNIDVTDDLNLLPLSAYKSFDFIQFYEGALLAIDTLEKKGLKADFYTYDVGADTNETRLILQNPELKEMDLIIGPLYSNSFSIISDFARDNNINIVNPFTTRTSILKNHANVFKVQPSIKSQFHQLSDFVKNNFDDSTNVFIIRHHPDKGIKISTRLKYELYNSLVDTFPEYHNPIIDLVYDVDSIAGFIDNASDTNRNVVIPLTNDKVFALNIMTKLNELKDTFNINVIGVPYWNKFKGMETKYMLNLNTHIFSPYFIDYKKDNVKDFVNNFRSIYKTEPQNYAFDGFDITYYFLQALMKYGRNFQSCLPYFKTECLHTNFDFKKTGQNRGYENTFWNIYKYENYKLINVKK
ncbi:MAG: LysM peptidoglycan-binding domain-containing protein [Bacteroidales bacterium]|nr:LysM peptidoglycan-binding domain-containing protein [Bacteroidales bacterium]